MCVHKENRESSQYKAMCVCQVGGQSFVALLSSSPPSFIYIFDLDAPEYIREKEDSAYNTIRGFWGGS